MRFGGDATLLSYGVKLDLRQPEAERLITALRAAAASGFPPSTPSSWTGSSQPSGSATTSSATPGSGPTCRWSGRPKPICSGSASRSSSWGGDCGKIVVHGHTVEDAPVVRRNRIGIDTGACWTGRLTCLVLDGTRAPLPAAPGR